MTELVTILDKCTGESPPPCQAACPLHLDVKGYVTLIAQGKFEDSLKLITEKLPFPGILGRVCSRPCETKCTRVPVDNAIAICALKRSAVDFAKDVGSNKPAAVKAKQEKLAIVGAGPAGLMAAYNLRKLGYQVTIFEALPFPGGMMRAGIPEYRLSRDILQQEVGQVLSLGIELKLNSPVHKLDDLFAAGYKAIFIAIGLHQGRKLPIPGADLGGVIDGLSFLRKVNSGQEVRLGKKVLVLGGGSVAIDIARVARRLGVAEVHMACLERRESMPAFPWEIEAAEEEGVIIHPSCTFTKIIGDNGRISGVECLSVKWMRFDDDGQLHLETVEGSQHVLEADTVIFAVGQSIEPGAMLDGRIGLSRRRTIVADPMTLETGYQGVFAGGDAVSGPTSIVHALASGRKAAISIDRYLKGEDLRTSREGEDYNETKLKVNIEGVARKERIALPTLAVEQRIGSFKEVELGFDAEQAKKEAERCLACECKLCVKDCDFLKKYCGTPLDLARRFEQGYFREKPLVPYSCNLCGSCEKVCPEGLNIGDMCAALRVQLVTEGKGPLPQHEYVYWNLDWSTSDSFALAQPDPALGECQRVFFPGCGLSSYSPSLVIKSYEYLRQKLPGTGIVLYCCGAPVRDLGQQAQLQDILQKIEENLAKLGATEIITGCTNCYKTFKQYAPQLKRKTIYEVILEQGLPDGLKTKDWTFSLHDSCPARDEPQIQESVRALAQKMGYKIEEMEHSREFSHCCGMGGMVGYADIWLALESTKRRAEEAHFDLLTYCGNCRETLANPEAGSKPALHILDLLFNPNWEQDRLKPPEIGRSRRENQAQLKKQLMDIIKVKPGSATKPH